MLQRSDTVRVQVDPDQPTAPAPNVFDDSDEEGPESTAIPQPTSVPKVSKLAELANKKRKEMVDLTSCCFAFSVCITEDSEAKAE